MRHSANLFPRALRPFDSAPASRAGSSYLGAQTAACSAVVVAYLSRLPALPASRRRHLRTNVMPASVFAQLVLRAIALSLMSESTIAQVCVRGFGVPGFSHKLVHTRGSSRPQRSLQRPLSRRRGPLSTAPTKLSICDQTSIPRACQWALSISLVTAAVRIGRLLSCSRRASVTAPLLADALRHPALYGG